tara:strand:+ start:1981 stop:2214 length:234 start_codon:yes stop_codon:yes gene_type:complete
MKKTQNQYYGYDRELPAKLTPGSYFITVDTHQIYIYDTGGKPKLTSSLISHAFLISQITINTLNHINTITKINNEWL